MQYNRDNELVQQNNIRESTYKINLDNAKKCAYSRVMVQQQRYKMKSLLNTCITVSAIIAVVIQVSFYL
jgi:hypothetical protein